MTVKRRSRRRPTVMSSRHFDVEHVLDSGFWTLDFGPWTFEREFRLSDGRPLALGHAPLCSRAAEVGMS